MRHSNCQECSYNELKEKNKKENHEVERTVASAKTKFEIKIKRFITRKDVQKIRKNNCIT